MLCPSLPLYACEALNATVLVLGRPMSYGHSGSSHDMRASCRRAMEQLAKEGLTKCAAAC